MRSVKSNMYQYRVALMSSLEAERLHQITGQRRRDPLKAAGCREGAVGGARSRTKADPGGQG